MTGDLLRFFPLSAGAVPPQTVMPSDACPARRVVVLAPGDSFETAAFSIIAKDLVWRRWLDRGLGFAGGVIVTAGSVLGFFAALLLEWR